MNLTQLKKIFIPEKIKTPQRLEEVLQSKHNPVKLFGISFMPKYKLTQDVFDKATKNKQKLSIPQKLFLIFTGKGNPSINLQLGDGAVFKAPKASFGNVVTTAKNAVIESVRNLTSRAGTTKVTTVEENNLAIKNAKQKIQTVRQNNLANDSSEQSIQTINGNNESYDNAKQAISLVEGTTKSYNASSQIIFKVEGSARAYNGSEQRILTRDTPQEFY